MTIDIIWKLYSPNNVEREEEEEGVKPLVVYTIYTHLHNDLLTVSCVGWSMQNMYKKKKKSKVEDLHVADSSYKTHIGIMCGYNSDS